MDPSSSLFLNNNAATMIDDWIEKNFPIAPLPASPPALASTTPQDWQSPYSQSPPALIPQDDDVSSVEIIEQKSSPALKYLDDDYSFVCLEKQSCPSLVSSIDDSVTLNSVDSFYTSTLHMLNGSDSSLEYLDQDSLETFNFNRESSLNPPDSPFSFLVAFTSSPDVKLASPPLFLPSSPTFLLYSEFKSSYSPGRIVKEEPRSDKIDESGLTSFINKPELAPSTSNKAFCYSPSPPKSLKKQNKKFFKKIFSQLLIQIFFLIRIRPPFFFRID
ncbi:hypothetical protein O181_122991 [Austropuccinia psidii MF-1]|uniref:Uncharacterized protein n=1 Tax=Austropuccinia psidii MF-1 TaxID=1389203 RepID=A0A9Q3KML3_9BASI|nr:hypothetical protein [Austropuccinia psidii MF-1]